MQTIISFFRALFGMQSADPDTQTDATEITPEAYAAILRQIRHIGGMMYHPDAKKVFTDDFIAWNTLQDLLTELRLACALSIEQCLEYCHAGARDMIVIYSEEKERWLFALSED